MTTTYTGEVPEKCEASTEFECKNADKTLKELGVFYDSVLPKREKLSRVCESCHITHGMGKHLGLRFELQENCEWKLIEEEVDTQKLVAMEKKVEEGFASKIKKVVKHVPFAKTAVACYYCAIDPQTPTYVKMSLLCALVYFISPIDLIPDIVPFIGYADDALVIFGVAKLFDGNITDLHWTAAEHFWEDSPEPGCECPYCKSI